MVLQNSCVLNAARMKLLDALLAEKQLQNIPVQAADLPDLIRG